MTNLGNSTGIHGFFFFKKSCAHEELPIVDIMEYFILIVVENVDIRLLAARHCTSDASRSPSYFPLIRPVIIESKHFYAKRLHYGDVTESITVDSQIFAYASDMKHPIFQMHSLSVLERCFVLYRFAGQMHPHAF
uniref:Uncharacterized protein n=1 Tax=Angiostrongylus cantonensis TaxID=6313 RepID=A0A0K0D1J8_ANGCA